MAGIRSGVATQIQKLEHRAVYLHCMAHSLNLAVQDTCRSINILRDMFDTVLELSKLFKYSAKKKALLNKLKSELSPHTPGVKPLCPTRWTVRAESLRSLLLNYQVILSVLEEILEEYSGTTESKSITRGIVSIIKKFSFLFGLVTAEKFLSITDTLSRGLQKESLCATEAQNMAIICITTLKDYKSDDCFARFWKDVNNKACELEVDEPRLPRKRRVPVRYDESASNISHEQTTEEFYGNYYFLILEKIIAEIERRFQSPVFTFYMTVEDVLRRAFTGEYIPQTIIKNVIEHFVDDLQETELCAEISMFKNAAEGMNFSIRNIKNVISRYQELFPQISKLFRLLLTMPATSATSERSFSSLRHIKTYLRASMKQERLNHLMIIYIHKDWKINYVDAMREFILPHQSRVETFGKI